MQNINQWHFLSLSLSLPQLLVLAPLAEIAQAIFAALFFDQGVATAAQAVGTVQLDVLGIGKNDGLAGLNGGLAIGVAPQNVEAGDGVHAADPGRTDPKDFGSSS